MVVESNLNSIWWILSSQFHPSEFHITFLDFLHAAIFFIDSKLLLFIIVFLTELLIFFRKKKCSNQIVLPLLIFSTISKLHSLFKLAIRTIPKVKNWYEMNLWCWNSIQDIHALYDFFSGWIKIKIQSIFDKIQTLIRRIWIEKL